MSCAWRDERCRIGLILGTGTNACYLEEIKDIHTIDQVLREHPLMTSLFWVGR